MGTRPRRSDHALALSWLMLAVGCRDGAPVATRALRHEPAPEAWTAGQTCTDLGAARVCWRGSEPVVVPRTLPEPGAAAPPHGWRCGGEGDRRVCEDRTRNASAFDCGTQRCLQARPRMPDDGEWECVEISGVVYCHSRGPVAGMHEGPADLGWLCGPRRGSKTAERVCVDFDADRPPPGALAGAPQLQCRFEAHFGVPRRSCTATSALRVGSACEAASACPEGTRCSAGSCLPERPEPACFFDRDCGERARCVFGSCRGA